MTLSPEEFARETGANHGFTAPHPKEWMIFWKEDVSEEREFDTSFPPLSLPQARQIWCAMEDHFFARYDKFLRVGADWGSTGIWEIPYPGSRRYGVNVSYESLDLPRALRTRFMSWQREFDEHEPAEDRSFSFAEHARIADELAVKLKRFVGPRIYVERVALVEASIDGTFRPCAPLLDI